LGNSLRVEGLCAGYGAVQVLDRISLSVNDGETVTLLGTNGNGKSTLMKCIMGIVPPSAGRISAIVDGVEHDLAGRAPEQIVDLGIVLVPEGGGFSRGSRWRKISCSGLTAGARARRSQGTSSSASRLFRALPSGAGSSRAA